MKYSIMLLALVAITACSKNLDLESKYGKPNNIEGTSGEEEEEGTGIWNEYRISKAITINQQGIDMQGFWPDGKLCVIPSANSGEYICFWGEKYSYRTQTTTPYPDNHVSQVTVENRVFGKGITDIDGFTDGGAWIIGIHRTEGNKLIGFFHAESHWNNGNGAYKSLGVAYSEDEGKSWTKGEKILNTNTPKPIAPAWSGLGDGCVVYNSERKQFICYYSANDGHDYRICMAVSSDPQGASGTWKKWDGNDFTIEGFSKSTQLGGPDIAIQSLINVSGANPSVLWNTYLQKWVMAYASWSGSIYMSVSDDGIEWVQPIKVFESSTKVCYPNLIGTTGDSKAGKTMRIYYGNNMDTNGIRDFDYRTIEYK